MRYIATFLQLTDLRRLILYKQDVVTILKIKYTSIKVNHIHREKTLATYTLIAMF